jgi:TetR/AcrR family acrAB operon transcriptional repressor
MMVRKTKGEAQVTYAALLDAAEQQFSKKGVTRTTLNDVAAAAGMTRGAIYWHFKDKNALFQGMCDRVFLPMQVLLGEIAASPDKEPLEALRTMMLHMLEQVATNPQQKTVFDILFHRCEKDDDLAFFRHEKQRRSECISKLEMIIREAVKQGTLPENTDTGLAVQALNAGLIGVIYEWLIDTDAYDLRKNAGAMVDFLLAGLVNRPPLKTRPVT